MANEATLLLETHVPLSRTVANGTGIERGALLTLSDPNTAALVSISGGAVAGIASAEKITSNGQTQLAVYDKGEFRVTASGAITVGRALVFDSLNKVSMADPSDVFVAGDAMETATDGETFRMKLDPRARGAA